MTKKTILGLIAAFFIFFGISSLADEGMWLLNNLPLQQLKDKYGFVPTKDWAENIQLSAVRLPNCSASFVSPDGLVMTNWHCAEEAVQKLSTASNNLYRDGFSASDKAHELKTELTLINLISVEDVTKEIETTVSQDTSSNLVGARRAAVSGVIADRSTKSGLKCEAVTLYQGGQLQVYCYKVYDDVRLVFVPEAAVGFFGGDADNFEYPRHNLDISFLRAYEGGLPARTSHYFKWSKTGAADGELVFAAGHPGSTQRLLTSSALMTMRDVKVPFILDLFRRREIAIQQFALRGAEEKRTSESDLFSVQNVRKLYTGKLKGLQDPKLIKNKMGFEAELLNKASGNLQLKQQIIDSIDEIGEAQEEIRRIYPKMMMIMGTYGFDSPFFEYMVGFVASGDVKHVQAALDHRKSLSKEALRYEEAKLINSLTHLVEFYGADNLFVLEILQGMGPADLARKIVYDSFVSQSNSNDPLDRIALAFLTEADTLQDQYTAVTEKERQGYAKLSDVIFKLFGTDVYPDATFTLRLAFGTVDGYVEAGQPITPRTTIGEAYEKANLHGGVEPWHLPLRWQSAKNKVNLKTPFDFVSTLDITGGNSGSPVFNRNLEIVGLIFDGNIHSLASDYDYNYSPLNRAVAVHSAGIIEALRVIYGATNLVKELSP